MRRVSWSWLAWWNAKQLAMRAGRMFSESRVCHTSKGPEFEIPEPTQKQNSIAWICNASTPVPRWYAESPKAHDPWAWHTEWIIRDLSLKQMGGGDNKQQPSLCSDFHVCMFTHMNMYTHNMSQNTHTKSLKVKVVLMKKWLSSQKHKRDGLFWSPGPGIETQISPNTLFQHGKNYTKFLYLTEQS